MAKYRKQISVSEFKAKALGIFEEVAAGKYVVSVTKRGKAIAEVTSAATNSSQGNILGSLEGTVEIVGDIVEPLPLDWSAAK
jgi:prevent-host-death family protein